MPRSVPTWSRAAGTPELLVPVALHAVADLPLSSAWSAANSAVVSLCLSLWAWFRSDRALPEAVHTPFVAVTLKHLSAMISSGAKGCPSWQQTLGRCCFAKCAGNAYHRHATRRLDGQWGYQAPAVRGPTRDRASNCSAESTDSKDQPKRSTRRTGGNRLRQNSRRIYGCRSSWRPTQKKQYRQYNCRLVEVKRPNRNQYP